MKRPANQPGAHRNLPTEPIPLGSILPLREAMRRLGWGARGLAAAKRRGLRVLRFSKWAYISTDDLLSFLRQNTGSDSGSDDEGQQTRGIITESAGMLPRTLPSEGEQ